MTTAPNTSRGASHGGQTNDTERKAFVPPRLRTHNTVQQRTANNVDWGAS